ncbi:MAG: hypothetical protein H7123_07230 [Thermoleophilia bacterium]|nr:hypothetical protein [Thermoleophilia bacterium]
MGALATHGGAMIASGTFSAAHSTQNAAVAAGPTGTIKNAVVANNATTFNTDTYASLTSLGRLLDELRSSLHLATAEPSVAKPAAAAPIVLKPVLTGAHIALPVDMQSANLAAPGAVATTTPMAPALIAPLAFIWNARYFQLVGPANDTFDPKNEAAVRERVVRSTIKFLLDEEHMDDFGVTNVTIRPVSPDTDADLLHVNAGARWVAEVIGVTGTGTSRSFPVVLNLDGRTYVDPRVHM